MICVTGATGYIGSHSARALAGMGEPLKVLVRPTAGAEEVAFLRSLGAEVVAGDACDAAQVERALSGCRAALHCVGGIQPPRPGDFSSLHEGPAEALALAARKQGVGRVVLVSALGVSPQADNAYHRTKARAEETLKAAPFETTVLRPSLVYGRAGGLRDSKLMVRMAAHLKAGRPMPLPGGGRAMVQPLFVGDLARAAALSAAEGVAAGRTVELGGPERMSLRAWVERVAGALGVRPRILPLPRPLALAAAALAERISSSPPITVDQVRVMGHNFTAALDSVQAAYGFRAATPAEGLSLTYGPEPAEHP